MSEIIEKEECRKVELILTGLEKATSLYALESYKAYIEYRKKTAKGLEGLMKSIFVELKSTIRLIKKGSVLSEADLHNLISSLSFLKKYFLNDQYLSPGDSIKYKRDIARIDGIFDKIRFLVESNNELRCLKYLLS